MSTVCFGVLSGSCDFVYSKNKFGVGGGGGGLRERGM